MPGQRKEERHLAAAITALPGKVAAFASHAYIGRVS